MTEVKTKRNTRSVDRFIAAVGDARRRRDCIAVMEIMRDITQEEPAMWGSSIIGFGSYPYRYKSGREGEWPLTGVSPRKQALTLYIMSGFSRYESLMAKLGKYRTGKSCLYIKKLEDIHLPTLKELIKRSVAHVRQAND